jgi:hypothetical protein
MTSADFEQIAQVTQYGAQRRQEWMQRLQANSDMATSAALAAHQADHNVITASQHGIMGAITPEAQAAIVARQHRVGDGVGAGRDLQRLGGVDFESQGAGAVGPVPYRADLTSRSTPPGYQRTEHPLRRLHEENR